MVIVRRCRREALCAAAARHRTGGGWNPAGPVFPRNVDHQVRLHPTRVVTARATPIRYLDTGRRRLLGVRLNHMLLETALLNEALRTHAANMRQISGMFLHVIEHSVLPRRCKIALRTDKFARVIPQIGHLGHSHSLVFNSRHGVVAAR